MRHVHHAAALLVAAALAAPLPADAAPRKVCNLLPGTGSFAQDRGVPYQHPLGIRSADVASNATHLTAVIRVHDLADPATSAGGRTFTFFLSRNPEENYAVEAGIRLTSRRFTLMSSNQPFNPSRGVQMPTFTVLTEVTGVVDVAKDEVRITAPLSAFRLRKNGSTMTAPRARVTYLGAMTAVTYGVDRRDTPLPEGAVTGVGTGSDFEYGSTRVTYALGAPSCVAVGR